MKPVIVAKILQEELRASFNVSLVPTIVAAILER